jgi:selenide,water dikinase
MADRTPRRSSKSRSAKGAAAKARASKPATKPAQKARATKSRTAKPPASKSPASKPRALKAGRATARPLRDGKPTERVRLTATVTSGGCACKLGPADLRSVLARLPRLRHPDVLVATETADDAGVFRLSSSQALVVTVDFFPPMVDDPFTFGQIAAANALSDVYAMGGTPLVALGIVAFPTKKLSPDVLLRIMEGANDRAKAAGAVILGGHSVMDEELKYGLAVTGLVHPKRVVRNAGAKAGDLLVLTKPLGTGIVCTGIKKRVARPEEEAFAIASMIALNDIAGSMLGRFAAHACTDVTGFGLAGHATEMAEASGSLRFEIDSGQLPLLPGTARLADDGFGTAGAGRNRDWLGRRLQIGRDVAPSLAAAVVDPQTSGGLLVSLPPKKAEAYAEALHAKGLRPAIIGRVVARPKSSAVVIAVE